jgi:hypothetical protein
MGYLHATWSPPCQKSRKFEGICAKKHEIPLFSMAYRSREWSGRNRPNLRAGPRKPLILLSNQRVGRMGFRS